MTSLSPEDLALTHLAIPVKVARKLKRTMPMFRLVDLEDMVASGMVGLVQASRSYRPGKRASFETWASRRIRGAIIDSSRRQRTQFSEMPRQVEDTRAGGTEEQAHDEERTRHVRKCMHTLHPVEANILIERARGGTWKKIGAKRNRSAGWAHGCAKRARIKLAPELAKYRLDEPAER